jgi:hypothetical protein
MKLAPPVIPASLKGGGRIVARGETGAKGANVDAVTDWGVAEFGGCTRTRPLEAVTRSNVTMK